MEIPLTENEKDILNKIYDMYETPINQEIKDNFLNEIEKRPNLQN